MSTQNVVVTDDRRLGDGDDVVRAQVEATLHRMVAVPCWLAAAVATKTATLFEVGRTVVELAVRGVAGDAGRATSTATTGAPPASPPTPAPSRRSGRKPDEGDVAPPAADLPIAGYESLAASQVVARLQRLTPDELRLVAAFEAAHRGRRTVLGKIDQLTAGER